MQMILTIRMFVHRWFLDSLSLAQLGRGVRRRSPSQMPPVLATIIHALVNVCLLRLGSMTLHADKSRVGHLRIEMDHKARANEVCEHGAERAGWILHRTAL